MLVKIRLSMCHKLKILEKSGKSERVRKEERRGIIFKMGKIIKFI